MCDGSSPSVRICSWILVGDRFMYADGGGESQRVRGEHCGVVVGLQLENSFEFSLASHSKDSNTSSSSIRISVVVMVDFS